MDKWIHNNLHIDLFKYVTDSQMHITNNTRRAKNEFINQGVKIDGVQYYNTHQESIQSNIVKESDIYNNYTYTSCVNWEIEKTPETHSKKLEFNIDKPETGLKEIDSNININNNQIDDMNNKEVVHTSDDLKACDYNNIEDNETQHKRTNRNNSYYTLVDDKL